jgi:predicted molibdopterin-dependent oxidoreductase YjgC
VQKFVKALEPPGQARPECEFLGELVHGVTGEAVPGNMEGLFNLMAKEIPEFAGLTWAGLGDAGVTIRV